MTVSAWQATAFFSETRSSSCHKSFEHASSSSLALATAHASGIRAYMRKWSAPCASVCSTTHTRPNAATSRVTSNQHQCATARGIVPHPRHSSHVYCTDNGPPFFSRAFAERLGFEHRKVTPLWSRANGAVESIMKKLRRVEAIAVQSGLSRNHVLRDLLCVYRDTPHTSTKVPPADLMFGFGRTSGIPRLEPSELQRNEWHKIAATAATKRRVGRPTRAEAEHGEHVRTVIGHSTYQIIASHFSQGKHLKEEGGRCCDVHTLQTSCSLKTTIITI